MKKHIFLLFVFLPLISFSQKRKNQDSLLKILPQSVGKSKVLILHDLAQANIGIEPEKNLKFAENALQESEKMKNDSLIISSLYYLSCANETVEKYSESIPINLRAIELAKKNGYKKLEVMAKGNICIDYFRTQQLDKVVSIATEGVELAKEIHDTVRIANFYDILGYLHKQLKNYSLAKKYWNNEIEIIKKTKRKFELGRAYGNLGELYAETRNNKEAIENYKKAILYFDAMNYVYGVAIMHVYLADSYLFQGNYLKSKEFYEKAIALNQTVQNPSLEGNAKAGLGKIALENKDFALAKTQLLEAEKLGKQSKDIQLLKKVYHQLGACSMAIHDFKSANDYDEKFTINADSLLSQNVTQRITEFQVKYETAKKDQAIAEQKNELFRQQAWLIGLIISILALSIVGYLFYNRYRLHQKHILQEAIIKEQKLGLNAVIEAQETERKRIAKDLHDGIAQELVALKLGFTNIQNKIEKAIPEEAKNFENISNQLNDSCTEVRNIAHVMMPPTLETLGLVPSLEMLLRNSLNNSEIKSEFEHFSLPERLDEKTELGLYRITQELLNNIIKHAQANKVVLQLYQAGSNLIMRLEDDGKSFDFEEARKKGSMGLLNILSRVSTLGGTFTSENGEKFGTVSTIRIPL